jgi:hypothetical protein
MFCGEKDGACQLNYNAKKAKIYVYFSPGKCFNGIHRTENVPKVPNGSNCVITEFFHRGEALDNSKKYEG